METGIRKLTEFLQVSRVVSTSKLSDFKGFALSDHATVFFFFSNQILVLTLFSCLYDLEGKFYLRTFFYLVTIDLGPERLY